MVSCLADSIGPARHSALIGENQFKGCPNCCVPITIAPMSAKSSESHENGVKGNAKDVTEQVTVSEKQPTKTTNAAANVNDPSDNNGASGHNDDQTKAIDDVTGAGASRTTEDTKPTPVTKPKPVAKPATQIRGVDADEVISLSRVAPYLLVQLERFRYFTPPGGRGRVQGRRAGALPRGLGDPVRLAHLRTPAAPLLATRVACANL